MDIFEYSLFECIVTSKLKSTYIKLIRLNPTNHTGNKQHYCGTIQYLINPSLNNHKPVHP